MNVLAPEEIELNKKHALLERLKDRLADREGEMADVRAELEQFEARYTMEVGRLYADLDDIEAQIAEEEVKLNPEDPEIKRKADEARVRAEESAAQAAAENWEPGCSFRWQPTVEAKKAYHKLARMIHPDLALDTSERERRHDLMAKLNDAYSAGDQDTLNKLVEDYRDSPDLITGQAIGDDLIRAIRRISQVKRRLRELRSEKIKLELSELFVLRQKVNAEMLEGRDLLRQMANRTKTLIQKAKRRLANLQHINEAEKAESDQRYGLNISSFR